MILDLQRLPILETERLRLNPLTLEDAEAIFPLLADPEVLAYWEAPEPNDPDVVAGVVRNHVEDMAAGRAMRWAMRRLSDGAFVGCFDITEIDRRHRRAQVGLMLGRQTSGEDYGLEAMRAVIAFAAANGLRKLTARTHLGARRSESVLEKLGFEEEGLLRGHILEDGERRDVRLFGLLL
ncbi:acetyltransferase, GNAT family [Phenylobacterium zucineum HLK1]|uniref:Acetyltransferase, GNAT family n=1 Tax=Phenylobacterium zucineum (strain HLK1) TaxID=450851 RepID=B4RBW7_PHEZH|nr:GNAT family N-acetyltransferase [Phenylobacterium zucineum]ACG78164.1 acetyltransferase, GNAT family [Phenylobacterium zucineum HLK1]